MICKHCKCEIEQGNYCPKCGKTLSEAKLRSKKKIGILAVLCLLVISGVACFIAFGNPFSVKVVNNTGANNPSEIESSESINNNTEVDSGEHPDTETNDEKPESNKKTEDTQKDKLESSQNKKLLQSSDVVIKDKTVYYVDSDRTGLYKISVEGFDFKKLSDESVSGGLLLLEDKIIFASDNIYVINLDGSGIQKLVNLDKEISKFTVYENALYYSIHSIDDRYQYYYDLYKVNIDHLQTDDRSTKQGHLIMGRLNSFCFDEEGFLYFALEHDGTEAYTKRFDIYRKKPSEETATKIHTFKEGEAQVIEYMKIENDELYIATNPDNYEVSIWNRMNKDGSDFKEICSGGIYDFVFQDGYYYFKEYLIGTGKPSNLVRVGYEEISNLHDVEYSLDRVLNWSLDNFYIHDSKMYLIYNTYLETYLTRALIRQNLDGTERELLYDCTSEYDGLYPNDLLISNILYADDNYTYFLGGYIKNDGTKLCIIDTQTGAKNVYTSNTKNNEIADWQILYDNFFSRKEIFTYDTRYAFRYLDSDDIPEVLSCAYEDDKLWIDIYTVAEEDGVSSVRFVDRIEASSEFSIEDYTFNLYYDSQNYGFYFLKTDPGASEVLSSEDASYNEELIFYTLEGGKLKSKSFMKQTMNVHRVQQNVNMANVTYDYEIAGKAVSEKEYFKAYKSFYEDSSSIYFDDFSQDQFLFRSSLYLYRPEGDESFYGREEFDSGLWITEPHYDGDIIVEEDGTVIYSTYGEIYVKRPYEREGKQIFTSHYFPNSIFSLGEYIYFSSYDKNNYGTFRVKKDGTQLTKLCDDIGFYFTVGKDPNWLYYYNSSHILSNSKPSLNRLNLKTNEVEELYEGKVASLSVVGDWIYFYEIDESDKYPIDSPRKLSYVSRIRTDGTGHERYSGKFFSNGYLYANENHIYFTHAEGNLILYRMNHDGTGMKPLVAYDDLCESVAITSDYIFYSNASDKLERMNLDGSGRKVLQSGDSYLNLRVFGDDIYFKKITGSLAGHYIINNTGTNLRLYTLKNKS